MPAHLSADGALVIRIVQAAKAKAAACGRPPVGARRWAQAAAPLVGHRLRHRLHPQPRPHRAPPTDPHRAVPLRHRPPARARERQQRLRRAAVGAPHGVGLKLRPPVGALGVQRRQHREVVQPEVGQAQAADGQRGMLAGQALV